jgi:transcription elongation factor Elf1
MQLTDAEVKRFEKTKKTQAGLRVEEAPAWDFLNAGTRVEVTGLSKATKYNELIGTIGVFFAAVDRYQVLFETGCDASLPNSCPKPIKVKRANLTTLLECSNCQSLMRVPAMNRFSKKANLIQLMQCHSCNMATEVATGKPINSLPRVAAVHEDPDKYVEPPDLCEDPVLSNCQVVAHIFAEAHGDQKEQCVATIECRNGLHIEEVRTGVTRCRKALLHNLIAMYKDTGSKEDAQKILEDLNDSDAAYNVKLPVNIRLDAKKPLSQWRVDLTCTVSRLTHKISFKTLLSGVMMRWCEVAVEPQVRRMSQTHVHTH